MEMANLLILPLKEEKPPGRKEMTKKKKFTCAFLKIVLNQFNMVLKACEQPLITGLPSGILYHPRMDVMARALSPVLAPRGEPVSLDRITVPKEFADAIANVWKTKKLPTRRPYEPFADVMLPDTLKEFVQRFDKGEFPKLVQKP